MQPCNYPKWSRDMVSLVLWLTVGWLNRLIRWASWLDGWLVVSQWWAGRITKRSPAHWNVEQNVEQYNKVLLIKIVVFSNKWIVSSTTTTTTILSILRIVSKIHLFWFTIRASVDLWSNNCRKFWQSHCTFLLSKLFRSSHGMVCWNVFPFLAV